METSGELIDAKRACAWGFSVVGKGFLPPHLPCREIESSLACNLKGQPVLTCERNMNRNALILFVAFALAGAWVLGQSQQPPPRQPAPRQPDPRAVQPRTPQSAPQRTGQPTERRDATRPTDAIQEAQTVREAATTRPEQRLSEHDRSDRFKADAAPVSTPVLNDQPDKGRIPGFDFVRDPLNALKPGQTFEESMKADIAAKPNVMADQKKL